MSSELEGVESGEPSYFYGFNTAEIKSHHVLIFALIVAAGLLFHFRHKIAEAHDRYRTRQRARNGFYDRLNPFEQEIADGLSSSNFDLEANVNSGDQRKGLSTEAKAEIKTIMDNQGISFDEARLQYTRSQLNENNIDSNGMPKDPKLVTF
ncbi:hypothetical protein DFJ63DRAFT_311050 [Scheffersomyces coipomensis]|uniref:uncharacterized protein n=1 Tax=Scheffersomyces coipomensis TaxID=1788519 RepID=UPI00315DCD0B